MHGPVASSRPEPGGRFRTPSLSHRRAGREPTGNATGCHEGFLCFSPSELGFRFCTPNDVPRAEPAARIRGMVAQGSPARRRHRRSPGTRKPRDGEGARPHDAIARRPMRIVNPSRAINWLQTRSSHSPSSKLLLRREPEIPSPPGGPRRGRPSAADLSRSRPAALSTLAVRTRTAGPIRCNPRALGVRASCELGTELRSSGQPSPQGSSSDGASSRLGRTPGDHDTGVAIVPITRSHSP